MSTDLKTKSTSGVAVMQYDISVIPNDFAAPLVQSD